MLNFLRSQAIDVIERPNADADTLVWRFERAGNEIKNGAKLIVREGQLAVFVSQGEVADVFAPGTYTLATENLPLLSTLQAWPHGFNSPFKAEVYFVAMRRFAGLKWGTRNPIMLRDAEFGAVRLRAFGTYEIRVADPVVFLQEVVGPDPHFRLDELEGQLRTLVSSRLAAALGQSGVPALDLAANYEAMGELIRGKLLAFFEGYGLALTKLVIENISLPPTVEAALDKRSSMGLIGDLNDYARYQAAEALTASAGAGGGAAAEGLGLGAGLAMGQQFANLLNAQEKSAPASPPPLPQATLSYFVSDGSMQRGPFAFAALASQIRGGQLKPDSLVWSEGMPAWAKAKEVEALAPLFTAVTPPPLPPSASE